MKFGEIQRRWLSQFTKDSNKISIGPRKAPESGKDEKDSGIVYYGPISNTIKKVKLLSLSTCCLSVSLGPVITFMTSPDMKRYSKGCSGFFCDIPQCFYYCSSSLVRRQSLYTQKLRWKPNSDSFEVEMMSWLATYIPKTIKFSDIRPADTNKPFVTFKAKNNFYFVDTEHCHNKALLAKLTPQKQTHESAFKNL